MFTLQEASLNTGGVWVESDRFGGAVKPAKARYVIEKLNGANYWNIRIKGFCHGAAQRAHLKSNGAFVIEHNGKEHVVFGPHDKTNFVDIVGSEVYRYQHFMDAIENLPSGERELFRALENKRPGVHEITGPFGDNEYAPIARMMINKDGDVLISQIDADGNLGPWRLAEIENIDDVEFAIKTIGDNHLAFATNAATDRFSPAPMKVNLVRELTSEDFDLFESVLAEHNLVPEGVIVSPEAYGLDLPTPVIIGANA